jgi:hypothetical protein
VTVPAEYPRDIHAHTPVVTAPLLLEYRSLFFRVSAIWRLLPSTPISSSSTFEETPYAKKYR